MEKNKLYVGNLSWETTENSLQDAFAECGEVVSAKIITDRNTNRSKGFGFVEMASDEAAEKAIAQFDGKDLDGRQIKVNLAKPKE
ncbi:MAG: RNA-binding protein [Elusimicrobiaceae bacterium]|jgi:cold-inducible RNA-binding protein|nr:RNA-binding protein [Elusimicrobiaceae bacterium]MBT3954804.1 RNA-binding protein [Elusimicrobiaceae bacterium]MBT4008798.1 RNA-binding protein [Elusimicrobiaceae bacterium]MBT4402258.1 RNA-binding protein [Elusimicrobiaceae bacterium]MBT4440285.1 RNA-binding protein [Elusimicrobiaceae bacterium]